MVKFTSRRPSKVKKTSNKKELREYLFLEIINKKGSMKKNQQQVHI